MFQTLTISDYLFTKCLLFAKVTLPDDEFRLYQRLFDIINQQLTKPDILIYLHAPVAKLQANIKKGIVPMNKIFRTTIYLISRKLTLTTSSNIISKLCLWMPAMLIFSAMKNILQ